VERRRLAGVLLLDPMIGGVRGVAAWTGGTLKKDYRTTLAAANPWGTTLADTGAVLRFRWAGREYHRGGRDRGMPPHTLAERGDEAGSGQFEAAYWGAEGEAGELVTSGTPEPSHILTSKGRSRGLSAPPPL